MSMGIEGWVKNKKEIYGRYKKLEMEKVLQEYRKLKRYLKRKLGGLRAGRKYNWQTREDQICAQPPNLQEKLMHFLLLIKVKDSNFL